MKTPTYEDYLLNPAAVMEQVTRTAHRERAEAAHRFIVAPVLRFLTRVKPASVQHMQARIA